MEKLRLCIFIRVFMCMAMIAPLSSVGVKAVFAQGTGPATTVIKHQAIDYFVSGHRIKIEAEVTDPAGVKLARCYFRAAGLADYVFVPMQPMKENVYEAVLPKPSKDTQTLEYILLAVNRNGQIIKTEVFRVEKNDEKEAPGWQQGISEEGEIRVSTELEKAPETLSGFRDSITLDVVESSARFGTAVGIYLLLQGGDSENAPEKASEGLSNKVIIGISAAVLAGGAAIIALGHDDDDDGDTTKPNVESTTPNSDFSTITVRFNEAMDRSVVSSSAVTITSSDPNVQWRAVGLDWTDDVTLSVRLDREGNPSPDDTVTLTLKGGVFKDVNGNYMDNYTSDPINMSGNMSITF